MKAILTSHYENKTRLLHSQKIFEDGTQLPMAEGLEEKINLEPEMKE